ncbi:MULTISPECIES: hypothetical protein [unclassified Streptomyces]|uniref:WD40 repeat domain-containing protein n=1 Tax=unclassified Streptomyces TaxID=2593676 RepID=UPI001CBBCCE3|nr:MULTISPECIES: hypothetical protein [unclassified Streptomyces]WPO70342.1 hypothetical protein R9806_06725 [Streptomyces sp. KN37]
MSEYHYSHEWGYLAAEAEQPDPRVVVSVGGAWVEQSRSLSEFLMRLAFERMPAHYGWTLRARTAPRMRSYGTGAGPAPTSGSSSTPVRATRSSRSPRPWASTGPATRRSARRASRPRPWRTLGPVSLEEGAADPRGRWTVVSRGPASPPPVPGAAAALVPGPAAVRAVAADQDATTLAAGDADGQVHVLETDDEHPETISLSLHRAPVTALTCLKLDSGRRLVLSGDEHGGIRYWSTRRKPLRSPFARRRTPVRALPTAQLETGPALAAAWADGLARVWDIASDAVAALRLGTGITFLGLDADGTLRVTDADGTSVLRLDLAKLWPHRDLQIRLDGVDWGSLWTSRGPGHMILDLIGKVASDDKKTAMDAVHDLYRLLVPRRPPRRRRSPRSRSWSS